jgi:HPt (histidine-containing phosphotransfer) domain-containing protein
MTLDPQSTRGNRAEPEQDKNLAATACDAVFRPDALLDLADQLQCTTIPRRYALTFLEMLQARVERILATISNNDTEDAMDAVLSLKVNAHMVGARSLEKTCNGLEQSILHGDMRGAARNAVTLPCNIDTLKTAMSDFLFGTFGDGTSADN